MIMRFLDGEPRAPSAACSTSAALLLFIALGTCRAGSQETGLLIPALPRACGVTSGRSVPLSEWSLTCFSVRKWRDGSSAVKASKPGGKAWV